MNAVDYAVWRDNLGATVALPNDPLDGPIGQSQYDNWRANFGNTLPGGAAVGGPEPGGVGLMFICMAAVAIVFGGFDHKNPRQSRGLCVELDAGRDIAS